MGEADCRSKPWFHKRCRNCDFIIPCGRLSVVAHCSRGRVTAATFLSCYQRKPRSRGIAYSANPAASSASLCW